MNGGRKWTGLQHARLHADLAAHRDDAALRQRLPEIPPLDQPHLLPAHVREHAAEQHQHEQKEEYDANDDQRRDHERDPFVACHRWRRLAQEQSPTERM
jgi:hypothetical protein